MKKKIIGIFVCTLLIATVPSILGAGSEEKHNVQNTIEMQNDYIGHRNTAPLLQTPEVDWIQTYDYGEFDMFRGVCETPDGGFIVSGSTERSNIIYPLVMKLDSGGNEVWNWTADQVFYDGEWYNITDSQLQFVHYYADEDIYIVCTMLAVYYPDSGKDEYIGVLLKFNDMGFVDVMTYLFDLDVWDMIPYAMCETTNGFMITGVGLEISDPANLKAALVKTDFSGVVQWYKLYDYDAGDDETYGICHTSDDCYILGGTIHYNTIYQDYWLIKTDADGNHLWNKTFGGPESNQGFSPYLFETTDGGYISGTWGGSSYGMGMGDLWIIKTDADGTMEWNETFGSPINDATWCMNAATEHGVNGYVFLLTEGFSAPSFHTRVIFTDENANAFWSVEIDDPSIHEMGQQIAQTSDGEYIITGRTAMYPSIASDAMIIKLSPSSELPAQPTMKARPRSGWIYLFDIIGLPFPLTTDALIYSDDFTFKAKVADASGVDKVEFFIDGIYINDTNITQGLFKTYNFLWTGAEKGTYNVKIRAYNMYGGTCKEEVKVKKLM